MILSTGGNMLIDDLRAGRAIAAVKRPYFAPIIYGFNFVPTGMIDTVACDANLNFYYNPEFVMTKEECVGAILHEVGHVFRKHHQRGEGKDPKTWNIAGDAVINKELNESGITLIEGAIDWKKEGLSKDDVSTTEKAYTFFSAGSGEDGDEDKEGSGGEEGSDSGDDSDGDSRGEGSGEGQDDDGEDDSGDGSDGDGDGDDDGDDDGDGKKSSSKQNGRPSCGSVADGVPKPYEVPSKMSPSSIETAIQESAQKIIESESTNPGSVPAGLAVQARALKAKSVSMEKAVMSIVGNAFTEKKSGSMDYTYARPSRRHHDPQIVFPSMFEEKVILRVGIVLDTSGSMGKKEIGRGLGVITSLSKSVDMEIYATSVDTRSYGVEKINPNELMNWFGELKGGGGTDLLPGIVETWEFDKSKRPDVIIMFSDGYVFFPDKKPAGIKVPIYLCRVIKSSFMSTSYPRWVRVFETLTP